MFEDRDDSAKLAASDPGSGWGDDNKTRYAAMALMIRTKRMSFTDAIARIRQDPPSEEVIASLAHFAGSMIDRLIKLEDGIARAQARKEE